MKKIFAISVLLVLAFVSIAGAITAAYSSYVFGFGLAPVVGNTVGGDTTVISVGGNEKYLAHRVDFSVSGNVTGVINLKLGDTAIYHINNATAGSLYGFNNHGNYIEGIHGADFVINAPAGSDIYYNIHGRTVQ